MSKQESGRQTATIDGAMLTQLTYLVWTITIRRNHHFLPMSFVAVQSFSNYIDAHITLGRLKGEGIDCWLKNEATATIIPVWTTAIGGIQLMVNKEQLQRAGLVLQTMAEEKKSHRICPQCLSHNVEYINTMRKPVNWLSAAVTFILGDLALMPEQRYHCFHCGAEFDKPLEPANN